MGEWKCESSSEKWSSRRREQGSSRCDQRDPRAEWRASVPSSPSFILWRTHASDTTVRVFFCFLLAISGREQRNQSQQKRWASTKAVGANESGGRQQKRWAPTKGAKLLRYLLADEMEMRGAPPASQASARTTWHFAPSILGVWRPFRFPVRAAGPSAAWAPSTAMHRTQSSAREHGRSPGHWPSRDQQRRRPRCGPISVLAAAKVVKVDYCIREHKEPIHSRRSSHKEPIHFRHSPIHSRQSPTSVRSLRVLPCLLFLFPMVPCLRLYSRRAPYRADVVAVLVLTVPCPNKSVPSPPSISLVLFPCLR